MISLIFLPVMIYPIAKKEHDKRDLRFIGFNTLSFPKGSENESLRFYDYSFINIQLTESQNLGNYVLSELGVDRIEEIFVGFKKQIDNPDSLYTQYLKKQYFLNFDFDESTHYEDLIHLLSLSIKYQMDFKVVNFQKNSFHLFYTMPMKGEIDCLLCNDNIIEYIDDPNPSWDESIKQIAEPFLKFWKKFYLIFLAYMFLVVVAIVKR